MIRVAYKKTVVCCYDFTKGNRLIEFSNLVNTVTNSDKKFSVDIIDVYKVIEYLNIKIYRYNKEFLGYVCSRHFNRKY